MEDIEEYEDIKDKIIVNKAEITVDGAEVIVDGAEVIVDGVEDIMDEAEVLTNPCQQHQQQHDQWYSHGRSLFGLGSWKCICVQSLK